MEAVTPITAIEEEIVDEFSLFDSWEDKYEYIIDMGKKLPALEDQYKKEENKIRGCQSTVWMVSEAKDGRIFYKADSDAVIVKGLISMLIRVFSGQKASDIVSADMKFIDDIGMSTHLAQTRSNGLRAMIRQMKLDAMAWNSKQ
ncbi:SufE family protein [Pollutibacter soli]|uniref:SufE family protein n=1 Tax=Pollutibacter soli TaxID=3034157 RepID=UPI003013C670